MAFYSTAQLARALDAEREGRSVDTQLSCAVAEMPKVACPLELEVERLRREMAELHAKDSFFVEGFKAN